MCQLQLIFQVSSFFILVVLDRVDCTIFFCHRTAVPSQKAVTAYFTSNQILPFGFAEQCSDLLNICIEVTWM